MNKNPALWMLVSGVVAVWNLYEIFGPQDEAPSQTLLILNWICVVCGVAGLVGGVIQLVQQKSRENA
jgi:hypothetical protein